ncbi:unnamed protein product [Rodentolepis nana]|uniref:BTB domain-containing protein n=1 Tax=Rodentolepis nana TaxID=102285 RepID=A0A0R3T1K0_RODNA|nr:unnamed protein product [Rodentolepis nana]
MDLTVLTTDGKEVLVEDIFVKSIPAFRDIAKDEVNEKFFVPVKSDILVSLCTWIDYIYLAPSREELRKFLSQYYDHHYEELNELMEAARALRFLSFVDVYENFHH